MDRPAFNPGDIVEVIDGGNSPAEVGVVIGVIDYSEDEDESRWELWVATPGAGGGMFEPGQVRPSPATSVEDLPEELRATWFEVRHRRDKPAGPR